MSDFILRTQRRGRVMSQEAGGGAAGHAVFLNMNLLAAKFETVKVT